MLGIAALATLVVVICFARIDPIAVAAAKHLPRSWSFPLQILTRFGRSDWMLISSGSLCIVLCMGEWSRVSPRIVLAWREAGAAAGFFFSAVGASGLITTVLKILAGRLRPSAGGSHTWMVFDPLSIGYSNASLPSGHATNVTAAAVALLILCRGRPVVQFTAGCAAFAIAGSRVALRAHYPSDVAAGCLVGAVTTILLAYYLAGRGVAVEADAAGWLKPRSRAFREIRMRRDWSLFGGLKAAVMEWNPARSAGVH